MMHCNAPVLFESTGRHAVVSNPANEEWLGLLRQIDGEPWELLARRYYLALYHFRKRGARSALPDRIEIEAEGKQQAFKGMLKFWEQRKNRNRGSVDEPDSEVFVKADGDTSDSDDLPDALRDFSKRPPSLRAFLSGPGRPPCDALCLLRAFLAAPLLGVGDDARSVHRLLHSNPTFAELCDFGGRGALKGPSELTSRRLPSLTVCEEFSEVMTRYGLWHQARVEQVCRNLASGVVEVEDTLCFDTTHIEAHSHCANVVNEDTKTGDGKKNKYRKVPRMRKYCRCGENQWETCKHPWSPTDHGAAVVVKGSSRIYWAHKASVASFADSEIPFDVRVCQYAAQSDGETLLPHLAMLTKDFPAVFVALRYILADSAYRKNREAIKQFAGRRLLVPVPNRKACADLAEQFAGITRFTATGIPICEAGYAFQLRCRDLSRERYIWTAPDNDSGQPVCSGCPHATSCMTGGRLRNIRVNRKDLPQLDWEHPQHFARDLERYKKRTGVERAIKLLKTDLDGEHLTHRDAIRVQAHLDRKLLIVHLLLAATAAP